MINSFKKDLKAKKSRSFDIVFLVNLIFFSSLSFLINVLWVSRTKNTRVPNSISDLVVKDNL